MAFTDSFPPGGIVKEPLDQQRLSFVVASIVADAGGVTKVECSEGYGGAALAPGLIYALPAGLVAANQSMILVQSSYTYASQFGMILDMPITLTDRFFLAPRRSIKVTRI